MNKYFITPLKQRVSATIVSHSRIEDWLKNWKIFFVLALGRSGTVFLSDLLGKAKDTYVFHEPVIEDFSAHLFAHYNPKSGEQYIKNFRKKEIYVRMQGIPTGIYGEVNGTLRCHADALKKQLPSATLLHLVRDGRDVVRSHMSRRTMTLGNPFNMLLHPEDIDPWKPHWHRMDRFARICWYWQEENRRARISIGTTIQFEKIISSYDYFHDEVLVPCGIHIEKSVWESTVNKPRNTTSEFTMPKWDQWTPEQQATFREICGEEMEKNGYSF